MVLGFWMLWEIPNAATKRAHFGGSAFPLSKFGFDTPKTIYVGLVAVAVTVHNQNNELVLTGEQKYLLKKRGAS